MFCYKFTRRRAVKLLFVYAEWHHITQICMFTLDGPRRLCYFFTSSLLLIAQALTMMLDGIEKEVIGKNLTKQELENYYLNRVDKEKEFFDFARMLSAQFSSVQMKKYNALGPLVKVKEKGLQKPANREG